MKVVISTVKRPKEDYLSRCIESIRQDWDEPIYLMIGGTDTSYTDKHENVIRYKTGPEEATLSDGVKRAGYGYYCCLTLNRDEPCIILEDDALLDKDWHKKLQELLTFTNDERFIMSLISPTRQSVPAPDIDVPSIQPFLYYSHLDYGPLGEMPKSTIVTYCNTTGIYYPTSMLQTRLPEFIYKFAVQGDTVHDLALGHYLFRMNLPIHIAVPNLCLPVDTADSVMGHDKKRSHVDYTDWDYGNW